VLPLESQSLCRLELMGALVAVQLTETLVEEMATKVEKITFWSDSITVLHYICQTSSPYKAFVKFNLSTLSTNNVFDVWNRLHCLHDHCCLSSSRGHNERSS